MLDVLAASTPSEAVGSLLDIRRARLGIHGSKRRVLYEAAR